MKSKIYKTTVGIISMAFLVICFANPAVAQNKAESVIHLESLSKELVAVEAQMWEYVKNSAHNKNAKLVDEKRKTMISTVGKAIVNVNKIQPYKGDDSYKKAVLKYLDTLKIIMNEDYGKLVNMEEVAEQSYDLMEAYLLAKELANKKLDEAVKELHVKQDEFAKKNNINLISVDSDSSKGLRISVEVMDYYNKIYLLFFKSYKQEQYLLAAFRAGDLSKIEQNRLTLIKYSEEGLKSLAKQPLYQKDASIKNSCETMLKFYKSEGAEHITAISDFLMKKDSFEKIKKSFDEKPESDKTQADVDLFNKKVEETNAATAKANQENQYLNTERSKLINEWNSTCTSFFDTHIPK